MYSLLLKAWFLGGVFVLVGIINDLSILIEIGVIFSIPYLIMMGWFLKDSKVSLYKILRHVAVLIYFSAIEVMGAIGAFILFVMLWSCKPTMNYHTLQ
jgi:hypothetical protein